ncbi:MAG: AAA family ATPase [Deltaproteobacteria bacterium]|nr:AAA family ATPase [Deltaproteobacteria bacterium]
MYRFASEYLKKWKSSKRRKPLVIRGARQVGKTYLVRSFAGEHFDRLLEINFEQEPDIALLFSSNKPHKIIELLELQFNIPISGGKTLIFLDEVQAAPEVLGSLRYFYEEVPEQHIIAAGSLLEFAFEEPSFPMPVGRIEYLYLGPMQFEEFLLASGKDKLVSFLGNFNYQDSILKPVHLQLIELMRTFFVTGGMPEPVSTYLESRSWRECESVKHALFRTFQDDFNKYGRRIKNRRLQLLFKKIPLVVGNKFKYVNIDRHERAGDLAKALNLLCLAHLVYRVQHSSCTGIPVGATADAKKFKTIFLDVGIMSTVCGLNLLDYEKVEDVMLVNSGSICEQYIGQHLLFSQQFFKEPELHYWIREKKGSSAEVDYVIAEGARIVPVEVKAGKSGSLKSLQVFVNEKRPDMCVRFNSEPPSFFKGLTALPDGQKTPFQLLSLPLYMAGQTRRLIAQVASDDRYLG